MYLDGIKRNNTMKNKILLLFFIFLIACKNEYRNKSTTIISRTNKVKVINENVDIDSVFLKRKQDINFIKDFYLSTYGNENLSDDKNKEKYISKRILKRLDSLTNRDDLILDYDPFIKGQDFFADTIKKYINIKSIDKDIYAVNFLLFGNKNEKTTKIEIQLKKDNQGNNKINAILNDEYLNFIDK